MENRVFFDRRSREHDDAEIAVPLGRIDVVRRALRTAEKAVIRNDHDVRIRAGQLHQATQHLVVKHIGGVHHSLKRFEKIGTHVFHPGRMKGHEVMPDVIDRFIVGRAEIPWHFFHHGRRYRVQRNALCESLGERAEQAQDLRIALIQSRGQRDELRKHGPRNFIGMEAQFREFFRKGRGMHAVRLRGPIHRTGGRGRDGKLVRDAYAVDILCRMAGVPPNRLADLPGLREDVP